jgi:hypothetical protein
VPIAVADRSSNKNEQVVHAAEVIGRSALKRAVFSEIYYGKRKIKTAREIASATGYPVKRVLDAGKALDRAGIVHQVGDYGQTGYQKIDFFHDHRKKILSAGADRKVRSKIPTKSNPARGASRETVRVRVDIRAPSRRVRARHITIDEIESFFAVRSADIGTSFTRISETRFKDGVASILGERTKFKDWGGEQRDLASTRVRIGGRRRSAAFAFKGPGKTGRLTPAKMGKNGDQIQRLFRCPAEVFVVQYWRDIDDSVLEQVEKYAQLKALLEGREILYGVIDGWDSNRLIVAYPKRFPGVKVE